MPHAIYIFFLFAFGACVGSFLNVVVWRLPRVEQMEGESLFRSFGRTFQALSYPPSHCPKCGKPLKWYDNLPVIGWIKLGGKCRFCAQPIAKRYPIVEAITGLLFVVYYVLFFIFQLGPCMPGGRHVPLTIGEHWPIFGLYLFTIAALLAASLIDAELFIIPLEITWLMAAIAVVFHTIVDRPSVPGALNLSPLHSALAAGAGLGLLISIGLWFIGRMPTSFPEGEPLLEIDRELYAKESAEAQARGERVEPLPPEYTGARIRAEIMKEVLFLLPPIAIAGAFVGLVTLVPGVRAAWNTASEYHWLTGLLGSVLGACVGAFTVWFFRIAGTLAFGRVAMGLGDVHLMFGVGAVVGAVSSVAAFFLAPFFAILLHVWFLLIRGKRELPYGPYLSLATAFVLVFSCAIADYLRPGMEGMAFFLGKLFG